MDGSTTDSALHDAWMRAMRAGDFETAWQVSDRVLRGRGPIDPTLPLHLQPVWDGTPLAGRVVLVRCHHGLGDTILFARYLRPLRRVARSVTVQAQAPLLPLLHSLVDAVVPLEAPRPPHEVAVEIGELPWAMRIRRDAIPADVPYLARPAVPMLPSADGRPSVGLVWAAGAWRPQRSVPLASLMPLAAIRGLRWASLQRGPALAQIGRTGFPFTSRQRSDDVVETARTMLTLDLVIGVDTMVAHLAGALGVPVWLLLSDDPDWRWMTHGSRSPYYPTMRLFRRREGEDWAPVVARVARRLRHRRPGGAPTLSACRSPAPPSFDAARPADPPG